MFLSSLRVEGYKHILCKINSFGAMSRQTQGLFSLTRAHQSRAGLPLAYKMPSWTKRLCPDSTGGLFGTSYTKRRPSHGITGNFQADIGTFQAEKIPSY